MHTTSNVRLIDRVASYRERALQMDDVSVCFTIPTEPTSSLKEFVIRRIRGRIVYRNVWALRGIGLTVHQGEAVGVIGRNGSGKSTLLRVAARVIRPTAGRVRVRTRVGSLIEVGAGFHPELTGRENVYLNGTLLGRTADEVGERLNDIVEFAEIGEFIDAPIRTYSTGMTLRLGFAVATAWDVDLLLVDEVLAVGDEAFRRKCAERIAKLRERYTALVLVSHDLALVRLICDRALWLDKGRIRLEGSSAEVTQAYHSDSDERQ